MGDPRFAKQVSVFLENRMGRLSEVCSIMGRARVNLRAFCTADTTEFGILRMIVSDIDLAAETLKKNGYKVKVIDVICLVTPDVPGALNEKLKLLAEERVDVIYMYGYSNGGKARLILKTSNPKRASELLMQQEDIESDH